jgi:vacuolar-type H+-ATPase subunit D/Vma8
MSTIERLKRLEGLVQVFGSDRLVDTTIHKLMQTKKQELVKRLNSIQLEIKGLEQTYQINSDEFKDKYNAGFLGDDFDYIKWASLIDMEQRLKKQMRYLDGDA